jgi:Gas vesicle synthesis protein GvpL/GvpF
MAAAMKRADDRVLYFYGVSELRPAKMSGASGVALAPIEAVDCEGIICWVSWVPAHDFRENLARNMENLDWLAEASVAHQRAVSAIAAQVEILPTRFGTVFRNEVSLRRHVGGRAKELKRDMARVAGADEWGVKVFVVQPAPAALPKVKSGSDYLKAKAALLPKRRQRPGGDGQLSEFDQALQKVASETAEVGNISSGQRGLAFQTSLLVKRSRRKDLEAVLKKYSQLWANQRRIECTGPWPPYSFVSREVKPK